MLCTGRRSPNFVSCYHGVLAPLFRFRRAFRFALPLTVPLSVAGAVRTPPTRSDQADSDGDEDCGPVPEDQLPEGDPGPSQARQANREVLHAQAPFLLAFCPKTVTNRIKAAVKAAGYEGASGSDSPQQGTMQEIYDRYGVIDDNKKCLPRQLFLPVSMGNHRVRRYRIDYRPTSRTIEAETYGRKDPGDGGGGQGWDLRAFGTGMAEWPFALGNEARAHLAHPARSL